MSEATCALKRDIIRCIGIVLIILLPTQLQEPLDQVLLAEEPPAILLQEEAAVVDSSRIGLLLDRCYCAGKESLEYSHPTLLRVGKLIMDTPDRAHLA